MRLLFLLSQNQRFDLKIFFNIFMCIFWFYNFYENIFELHNFGDKL